MKIKSLWVSTFSFVILMVTVLAWSAPVPDTGQTKCYDDYGNVITCPSPGQPFYGQDANYSINPISYTKLDGNGNSLPDSAMSWVMVRDNVTGLIWEMKTNKDGKTDYNNSHDADNTYTCYDSNPATSVGYATTSGDSTDVKDFVKALNDAHYGGYGDWRLPTIKELTNIVNFSISYPGPTIDTRFFPNTHASFYWSSTTYAFYTNYAWGMDFDDGGDYSTNKYSRYYVRAVCGGQIGSFANLAIGSPDVVDSGSLDDVSTAAGGYKDNGDGTVMDTSTGLTWQQATPDNLMTWEEALSYCETLNLGNYTDWRLPTIMELLSLVDHSSYNPAINTTYFPDTVSSFYWSSTTGALYTHYAWGVYFYYGDDYYFSKNYNYYHVRAVRGGQSGYPVLSVSPANRNVAKDAGATTFSVSNTGAGTMTWTTAVTSGGSWLSITSGVSGTDVGTINCSFTANTSTTTARIATIRVTSTGETGANTTRVYGNYR